MAKPKKNLCASPQPVPPRHRLAELFWTLGPAFTRWAEAHMDQSGLTPQRIRLMALLLENGPMIMSSLRDALGVTATNVTALVDALEEDGMVARKPHPTDRRAIVITLTAKAEKQLTENCPIFKERVSQLFTVFSVREQEQLVQYLLRVREALVERNILEASDFCPSSKKACH